MRSMSADSHTAAVRLGPRSMKPKPNGPAAGESAALRDLSDRPKLRRRKRAFHDDDESEVI